MGRLQCPSDLLAGFWREGKERGMERQGRRERYRKGKKGGKEKGERNGTSGEEGERMGVKRERSRRYRCLLRVSHVITSAVSRV